MKIAVVGLGNMGRALAHRLLDEGHSVAVWNRTSGRSAEFERRGVTALTSPDDVEQDSDAVVLCLADDSSTLDVAAPSDVKREAWARSVVVNTGTVSPGTAVRLTELYGAQSVAAPIIGAPHAVRSGAASVILGGSADARHRLAPLLTCFSETLETGEDATRAVVLKLLHNQMLLVGLTVSAEAIRIGRAAGVDDDTLARMLQDSAQMPAGLKNRVPGLFDPQHSGWFSSPLAAKDIALALDLTGGDELLPVTEAARQTYLRVSRDGWGDADITAAVEIGANTESHISPKARTARRGDTPRLGSP